MKTTVKCETRNANLKILFFTITVITILFTTNLAFADEQQKVRKPVFAGSFYPADRNQLEKKIDGHLKEAEIKSEKFSSHVFGVIAPHAGYDYSGLAAAYSYNQIRGGKYKTVVIIGPSHRVPFKGVSIYPSGAWETPLGKVAIDGKAAQMLMDSCKLIKALPPAFEREHSLEVQLPSAI